MRIRTLLVVLTVVAVLGGAAVADVVHLKGGGKIEGEILSDEGGKLRVKTRFGEVTIEKSKVERIEKRKTVLQEYEERLAALGEDDVEGCWDLVLFCRENRLAKQEKELVRRVLELDDQHPGANEAVGNVEHEGRWMTPAERDRLVAEGEDAAMRAKGLVRYRGEWVTPEEKEKLEAGLVRYRGKWMTPDDVKRAKGLVKHDGEWIPKSELERRKILDFYRDMLRADVEVALTDHVAAIGTYSPSQLGSLAQAAEQTLEQFCAVFGIEDGGRLFRGSEEDAGRKRLHVVYSKRAFEYARAVDGMKKRYPKDIPDSRANLMRRQKGFYFVYPACYVIGYQLPNTFEQVRASVIHKTSHVLLLRYRYRSDFFPWWLIEGLGSWQEILAIGQCDTYCITDKGYAANEGPAESKWGGMARWRDIVKQQVIGLHDRSWHSLAKSGLNDLSFRDLAKSWSICEWLINHDRETFVKMVDKMKSGVPFKDAVSQAFGKPVEQVEKEWRDYVRDNY